MLVGLFSVSMVLSFCIGSLLDVGKPSRPAEAGQGDRVKGLQGCRVAGLRFDRVAG